MVSPVPNTEVTGYQGVSDIYAKVKQTPFCKFIETPTVEYLFREIQPGARVLDMGCGAGFYTERILEKANYVEGIDSSQDQIVRAQTIFYDNDRAFFKVGNAESYCTEQAFDYVVGINLLHYANSTHKLSKFFTSISNALVPGGLFLGIIANPFISVESYSKFEPYGFQHVCEGPRYEGSKIVCAVKEPVELDIIYYWWSPETYKKTATDSGLDLQFLDPRAEIPPSENPDFWRFCLQNSPLMPFKARKRRRLH